MQGVASPTRGVDVGPIISVNTMLCCSNTSPQFSINAMHGSPSMWHNNMASAPRSNNTLGAPISFLLQQHNITLQWHTRHVGLLPHATMQRGAIATRMMVESEGTWISFLQRNNTMPNHRGAITTSCFEASNCSNATPTTKMLLQKRKKYICIYERRGKMKVKGKEMF